MSNQKIIKAIAGIAAAGMMATCLPVAAFAATGDTYHFSFSNGSSQDLAPGGSMTFPASQYDYGYWITLQGHGGYTYNYYPGDTLPYDAVDQWFTADGITSCYAAEGNPFVAGSNPATPAISSSGEIGRHSALKPHRFEGSNPSGSTMSGSTTTAIY